MKSYLLPKQYNTSNRTDKGSERVKPKNKYQKRELNPKRCEDGGFDGWASETKEPIHAGAGICESVGNTGGEYPVRRGTSKGVATRQKRHEYSCNHPPNCENEKHDHKKRVNNEIIQRITIKNTDITEV